MKTTSQSGQAWRGYERARRGTGGQNAAQCQGRWSFGNAGSGRRVKKRAPAGWCCGALVGSKNRATFSAFYHCDQKPSVKEACSEEEEEAAAVPLPYHFFSLLVILLDSVVGSP